MSYLLLMVTELDWIIDTDDDEFSSIILHQLSAKDFGPEEIWLEYKRDNCNNGKLFKFAELRLMLDYGATWDFAWSLYGFVSIHAMHNLCRLGIKLWQLFLHNCNFTIIFK